MRLLPLIVDARCGLNGGPAFKHHAGAMMDMKKIDIAAIEAARRG